MDRSLKGLMMINRGMFLNLPHIIPTDIPDIPEIDNSNWDIYRGFGCIDVQAAINYINNNQ